MIKRNKRYLHIAFVVALLVVIASVCRDLNVDSILRSTTGIFLGLTRSTIYIGLFSAWGFSVRQRIVSQNVRRLLTAEAGLLVLWMLIRTVKYHRTTPAVPRTLECAYIAHIEPGLQMTDLCHGAKVMPNGEKYKSRFDMKKGCQTRCSG